MTSTHDRRERYPSQKEAATIRRGLLLNQAVKADRFYPAVSASSFFIDGIELGSVPNQKHIVPSGTPRANVLTANSDTPYAGVADRRDRVADRA